MSCTYVLRCTNLIVDVHTGVTKLYPQRKPVYMTAVYRADIFSKLKVINT